MVLMVAEDPYLKRLSMADKALMSFQPISLNLESNLSLKIDFVLVIPKCLVCSNFIMRCRKDCGMVIRLPRSVIFLPGIIISSLVMF